MTLPTPLTLMPCHMTLPRPLTLVSLPYDSTYTVNPPSCPLCLQILRFMNDATLTGRRLQVLANYIIEMALSREPLQNEVFVQLCNQTWLNRDEASVARGWLLASCCMSAFTPSPLLANYLLKYGSHALTYYLQLSCLPSFKASPKMHRLLLPGT